MKARPAIAAVCALAALSTSAALATPTLTTLVTFNGTNGAGPSGSLIADPSGNFYGTTFNGGSSNDGTAFEIAAGTHALSTLATFNSTNGKYPLAGLIADSLGNLYGTTFTGGSNSDGTVFKIAAGTNTLSTLVNFNGSNGLYPHGGLMADSSGNLYGTTSQGGSSNDGTVFEIASGTSTLTTLANFNGSNGEGPECDLVADAAGNLYGTTEYGGPNNIGTVFKVATGSNALSALASFNGSNGSQPAAGLIIDSSGNLFGTTYFGGSNGNVDGIGYGTVFKVAAGTNALSTLVVFNETNGYAPFGDLIADAAGNLYGITFYGGASGDGEVFEVAAGTDAFSTLASFNITNGENPVDALYADASGNLYGATSNGGLDGDGTLFELTGTGFVVPEPSMGLVVLATAALARRRRISGRKARSVLCPAEEDGGQIN